MDAIYFVYVFDAMEVQHVHICADIESKSTIEAKKLVPKQQGGWKLKS
jgi:hypothetical protein